MSEGLWIALAVIAVLLVVALVVGLVRYRRRRIRLSAPDTATPVDRSDSLSHRAGRPVILKPEHLQRTGSFKIRGAYNLVSRLRRHLGPLADRLERQANRYRLRLEPFELDVPMSASSTSRPKTIRRMLDNRQLQV